MGDVSESELYDAFAEQATAFQKGLADAVCIETMSALDEADIISTNCGTTPQHISAIAAAVKNMR